MINNNNDRSIKENNKKNNKDKIIIYIKNGLYSSASIGMVTLILYPLENWKSRFQLQGKLSNDYFIIQLINLIKKIYNKQGFGGFYIGFKPYLIYNMLSYGVFRLFKEFLLIKFKDSKNKNLISSYLAGLINTIITTPFSVLSNFLIYNSKKDTNITLFKGISMIYKKNGIRGFYSGLLVSLFLVINPTINFTLIPIFKNKFKNLKNEDYNNFLSGICSKMLATLITYPYQTIKTHQQGKTNKKLTIIRIILLIIFKKGFKGFYDGAFIKLFETAIKNGLYITIYERFKKL